jgi:hypothetical protein
MFSYFGQPLAGFFFRSDSLTASRQSPCSLSVSGFGPGGLVCGFGFLIAFFSSCVSVYQWFFIHQPFPFGCLYCCDRALSIVELAMVPHKVKLPQIPMQ